MQSGTTTSAIAASGEPGSLVTAIAGRPCLRAAASSATTSGDPPDCDTATTAPPRSDGDGKSPAKSHGAARPAVIAAWNPNRYWAERAALSELPRPPSSR